VHVIIAGLTNVGALFDTFLVGTMALSFSSTF